MVALSSRTDRLEEHALNEGRKQPSIGFCIATVLVPLVVYFLSLGPVVWGFSRIDDPPQWLTTVAEGYIAPARFVHDHGPEPVKRVLFSYVVWFAVVRPVQ